jgi:thioredoxin 1
MGANTKTTTDATFAADVLQSDKPVLVDFWAEWCGPCKMIAPVLEEIAGENADKISIVKLNIDENPGAARDYQIMSIPTMAVFQGGKIVLCAAPGWPPVRPDSSPRQPVCCRREREDHPGPPLPLRPDPGRTPPCSCSAVATAVSPSPRCRPRW